MDNQNVDEFLKEVLTNPDNYETLHLSQRDAEVFANAFNRPPVINEKLAKAIRRYKQYIGESNG